MLSGADILVGAKEVIGMAPYSRPLQDSVAVACLIAIALVFTAPPAAGQFQPAPGREYREFHNPVNPVRGQAVVGLAVAPKEADQRADVVQVFFPQPYSGEVQIETATADGRFRGEGVYVGSTKGREWLAFPLTSSSPDGKARSARPASPTSLAITARGPEGMLYLVRWGEAPPSGSSEQVRLYVNSRRAEMFVRAGSKVVRCTTTATPQPVRFDAYCDIALTDVPGDGQLVLIRRDQFNEQTQAFKVHVP
jgi:hypothetical protein